MKIDLSIQCVAMNTKHLGSSGLISFCLAERGLYEFLFKFAPGLTEKNAPVDHFRNERFQLLFHNNIPLVKYGIISSHSTTAELLRNRP